MSTKEWEKNVDLYIHHDNLRQHRLRHWITIEAVFIAFAGLLVREGFHFDNSIIRSEIFVIGIAISAMGLFTTKKFRFMHRRAIQFMLFHRMRLCEIEANNELNTFTRLAEVLTGLDRNKEDIIKKHQSWIDNQDERIRRPYRAASDEEERILFIVSLIWILLIVILSFSILLTWFGLLPQNVSVQPGQIVS